MLNWITDRIMPSPLGPRDDDPGETARIKQDSRETAARVNKVVDEWNERLRRSWEHE